MNEEQAETLIQLIKELLKEVRQINKNDALKAMTAPRRT